VFNQLKQLFTQSLVYGVGYVMARLVTFLLLPLYTNVLTQEEYGIIGLGFFFAGVAKIFFAYGSDPAFIRYYELEEDHDKRRLIFSTNFWSLLTTSLVFTGIIYLLSTPIAGALFDQQNLFTVILLIGGILLVDTLTMLPKTLLRIREQPYYYTAVNLVNVIITLALNIYFIVHLDMGVFGAFLANTIASFSVLLFLLPVIGTELRLQFSWERWKDLLRFGLPLIPAGLSAMLMEMIDRPILKELTDVATVGLYNAGYKLGIFIMLVVSAFHFAWQPFFMKAGQQDDGPKIFAQVFTYFMFVVFGFFVVLTLLLEYIVQIPIFGVPLLGENFTSALSMVPIIFAAYIMYGAYLNFLPGVYLKKKSGKLALYGGIGASVNIIGNLLLIPSLGINGAAIATLLGYASMALLLYFENQRLYPTPYQWNKVMVTVSISLGILAIYFLWHPGVWIRILLIALYVGLHFTFGFIKPEEMKYLKALFRPGQRGTE